MKFSHIKFLGTDQEVLDFVGTKKFDYETDYSNTSVNVRLFGSHGKCNVPLGYHFVKDSNDALSVLTDEVSSYIAELEKENAELKKWQKDTIKARGNDYMDWSRMKDQLTKAKEIIRTFLNMPMPNNEEVFADVGIFLTKAEQFLKEIEK